MLRANQWVLSIVGVCAATGVCAQVPLPNAPRPARGIVAGGGQAPTAEGMWRKASSIRIPALEFRATRLADALEFLRQQAWTLDGSSSPENRGVNILLKTGPAIKDAGATPITLRMNAIPLLEAVRYLASQAGLKVRVEPYALSLVPISDSDENLVTATFRVQPSFFSGTPAAPGGGK